MTLQFNNQLYYLFTAPLLLKVLSQVKNQYHPEYYGNHEGKDNVFQISVFGKILVFFSWQVYIFISSLLGLFGQNKNKNNNNK